MISQPLLLLPRGKQTFNRCYNRILPRSALDTVGMDIPSLPDTTFLQHFNPVLNFSNHADNPSDTRDLDIANIIFIDQLPQVPESQIDNLKTLVSNVNDWEAWESARCEQAVHQKVQEQQLPGDNTVNSKSKRTQYRSKVCSFLRTNSPWFELHLPLRCKTNTLAQAPDHQKRSSNYLRYCGKRKIES